MVEPGFLEAGAFDSTGCTLSRTLPLRAVKSNRRWVCEFLVLDIVLLVIVVSLVAALIGEWLGYARGYRQGYEKARRERAGDDG